MATHNNFSGAFKAMYSQLSRVAKTLPAVLANEGTRFWISNFEDEGFLDGSLKEWKVPERKIPGTPAYKYPKKKGLARRTRKTLVQSGKLKRAVNTSLKSKSIKRIEWEVSGIPYAQRHNEGLDGMPERKFMGKSEFLFKRFKLKIKEAYNKTFQ